MQADQLKLLLLFSVAATGAGMAGAQPAPVSQTITIHASQALPKSVQDLLVRFGEPRTVPIAAGADPYAEVRSYCGGSVTNEYLGHVAKLNTGFIMNADPAQRMLMIPPCVRLAKNKEVEVLPKDSADSFLMRSVGVSQKQVIQLCDPKMGKPKVFASCYMPAGDALVALNGGKPDFKAGRKLLVPSLGLPTTITLKPGITAATVMENIEAALPVPVAGVKNPIDVSGPTKLRIIKPLSSDNPRVTGTACAADAPAPVRPWPLDSARITAILADSVARARDKGRLRAPTAIRVADTGFMSLGTFFPKGSFWFNEGETPEGIGDPDGNGHHGDYYGIDAADRGNIAPYPDDEYRQHGTQVADYALGGAALRAAYPQLFDVVKLNFFKIYSKETGAISVNKSTFLEAMSEISGQAELRVVNYSVGAPDMSSTRLFNHMMQQVLQRDFLVVLAAGNDGPADIAKNPTYPASYGGGGSPLSDWIITVGASAPGGSIAPLSSRGNTRVDLLAPGCRIPFQLPGEAPQLLHGTSFAAPLVSFTAAALKTLGIRTMPLVKRRIIVSADFDPKLDGDTRHGGIVLNIERALSVFDDSLRLRGDETGSDIVGTWQQQDDGEIEVCKGELMDPRKLLSVSAYEEQSVTRLRVYYTEIDNVMAHKRCEPAAGGIKLVDKAGKPHDAEWKRIAAFVPADRFN